MKVLFALVLGSNIVSLLANLIIRVYLFVHRPLSPDLENGFVVPFKLIGGLSYVKEQESNLLEYLLIYTVLSFAVAFWLRAKTK
jgi:hypothetical protein